jgi:hypothetical protein
MASSTQLAPDSQVNGSQVKIPDKPLKGKYDGRRFNGRERKKGKSGPKPNIFLNLAERHCKEALTRFEAIATLAQIYEEAWNRKNLALCVQMRENAADRAYGRPFVSINPAEKPGSPALTQDNRLQLAIGQLNIGVSGKKTGKSKRLASDPQAICGNVAGLASESQVIDSTATVVEPSGDPSSQEGQGGS